VSDLLSPIVLIIFLRFRSMLSEMLNKLPSTISGHKANGLPAPKNALPPLDKENYPNVRFWMKKTFKKARRDTVGDTDALATGKRKRGRPKRDGDEKSDEENEDTRHLYIEDKNGRPVDADRLWKISVKARQCWFSLQKANLAPLTWSKINTDAYEFFKLEMLHEFQEFRFCDACWKLDHWATLNYPSWVKNHLKLKTPSEKSTKKIKIRAESPLPDMLAASLNDASLIPIDTNPESDSNGDLEYYDNLVDRTATVALEAPAMDDEEAVSPTVHAAMPAVYLCLICLFTCSFWKTVSSRHGRSAVSSLHFHLAPLTLLFISAKTLTWSSTRNQPRAQPIQRG
jgi:hypothetical protein